MEQREKIKISVDQNGEKVYMITALPAFSGDQPLIIAGSTDFTATSTVPLPANNTDTGVKEITGDKGPVITLSIDKKAAGEFGFTVLSTDPAGMDFIEILQNGVFLDVELCSGSKQCTMKKSITLSTPGETTFLIKAMNKNGKLSFQEELVNYDK